jgi:glutathione S-transferase
MKLYEFAPTRSIRVRWLLQELGVPFESVVVNPVSGDAAKPEFLKINPAAKVPVLEDGGRVITESVAIVLYLAEKYRDKGFLPADLAERAQVYRWLLFAATELEQPLWRIAKHEVLYPEADRIEADIPLAGRDFRGMAKVLEEHMSGRKFLVGDSATCADFVMAYTLDWANMYGFLDACPELRAYLDRMYARPRAAMRIADAFKSVGLSPGA